MTIAHKYRSTKNWKEIIKVVQKSSEMDGNFVWQTTHNERIILPITGIEVLPELNIIKLAIEDAHRLNLYDESFLKLEFRDTVFKVTIFKIEENIVSILVPDEVKAKEMRENPRTKFRPKDEKMITMSLTIGLTKVSHAVLQFQVIDISKTGLSIVVSDQNLDIIQNAVKFNLEKLGEIQLTFKVPAELIYSHKLRYRYRGAIIRGNRIGFKFNDKLEKDELEDFLTSYG